MALYPHRHILCVGDYNDLQGTVSQPFRFTGPFMQIISPFVMPKALEMFGELFSSTPWTLVFSFTKRHFKLYGVNLFLQAQPHSGTLVPTVVPVAENMNKSILWQTASRQQGGA